LLFEKDYPMTDATVTADKPSTKPRRVERYFLTADGKRSERASADAVTVVHEWKSNGYKLEMNLADLSPDVIKMAALFGISQVVGNAYGGETDDEAAADKAESRWETLAGGRWATERETGERVGDIVEAFAKAFTDAGKTVTDEWKAQITQQLADGVLDRKEALKNPRIRAAFDAIKLRRAQERAAKSAAAAAEAAPLPDLGI
jgi:hypothetical protein